MADDVVRRHPTPPAGHQPDHQDLVDFLTERLTEDLAEVWGRDAEDPPPRATRRRPGMAAQVAVIDDLLNTLAARRLPTRTELRMLLFGYGTHPDYEPAWADALL